MPKHRIKELRYRKAGPESGPSREGTVKSFNATRGYGFIATDNGEDLFVHRSSIVGEGFGALATGERVKFEISEDRGVQAVNVRKVQEKQALFHGQFAGSRG